MASPYPIIDYVDDRQVIHVALERAMDLRHNRGSYLRKSYDHHSPHQGIGQSTLSTQVVLERGERKYEKGLEERARGVI
jgi:hypothetical protein